MRLFSALFAVVALALPLRADDELLLTFNQSYKPGNRYHQTMTTRQQMEMDTAQGKQTREMSTTTGMIATVTAFDDQRHKRVAVKYDSVKVSLSDGVEKLSFDSKAPEASDSGRLAAYNKVVGQQFGVVFDDLENVTDVENLETAIQNLAGNNAEGAQVQQQLLNPESLKQMMQQANLRSPVGRPIKVGGEWPFSQQMVLPGIGKLVIYGVYTFKGMVKRNGVDCAEIGAAAEIKLDIDKGAAANADVQRMQLKMETGKMTGILYYDPAISFTRELKIEHDITLTGRLPDGSGKDLKLPMKQQIEMKLDSFEPIK